MSLFLQKNMQNVQQHVFTEMTSISGWSGKWTCI